MTVPYLLSVFLSSLNLLHEQLLSPRKRTRIDSDQYFMSNYLLMWNVAVSGSWSPCRGLFWDNNRLDVHYPLLKTQEMLIVFKYRNVKKIYKFWSSNGCTTFLQNLLKWIFFSVYVFVFRVRAASQVYPGHLANQVKRSVLKMFFYFCYINVPRCLCNS